MTLPLEHSFADALPVWDELMAAGHDYGITPCGILAMDMARVEAGLFMLDVDYTSAHHAWVPGQKSSPYEMGLGWTVNLAKEGYFVAAAHLPFPGLGHLRADGKGYAFVPVDYRP